MTDPCATNLRTDLDEPVLADPIRMEFWRRGHLARRKDGIAPVVEAFAVEAAKYSPGFGLKKAWRVVNAITSIEETLRILPRWVAESLAKALEIDPVCLRPAETAHIEEGT